jgi:two-component system, NtrC family, response regulator AtoC
VDILLFDDERTSRTSVAKLLRELGHDARSVGLEGVGFFSEAMRALVSQAQKYHTDRTIPVLIEGETGTGKEIISKMIHYGNLEFTAPFVDINCAAITPNLFESELFGYEAGSFRGGLSRGQKGKIDLAAGGTLFLDEVGEIPLELQGKLLRVIQEKEFYRIGGLRKIKADVRIICATNSNLEQAVAKGTFRKDLYYRLKVGHIQIPSLRERMADIYPLALMFLQEFSRLRGKQFTSISEEAAGLLLSYAWPGNVRELRNTIEWATFMYDDAVLKPQHLGIIEKEQGRAEVAVALETKDLRLPPKEFSLEKHIDHVVYEALRMHHGNKTATAQYLGISRRALCYRLDQMEEE